MADTLPKKDVDQGFAWAILAGCFFMYMFVVGTIKAYGVLYTEMVSYFNTSSGDTAWIGSVCLLLMLGLGPFANWLSVKFSFRTISFIGGVLLGIGYVASAFAPQMEYLYVTFGVFAGLGYGLAFSPCSTIISFYFDKRRALANGITVSASGIGAFCFPFLYQFLIENIGLRGTFWLVGGMLFNVCVAACIFVQPEILQNMKLALQAKKKALKNKNDGLLNGESNTHDDVNQEKTPCCEGLNFNFKLFLNPRFTLYAFAFSMCMNGYGNNLILIPSQVKALGYDKTFVVLSVSIMGGFEVVSRIFFGWFADKKIIKHKYIFLFSMVISAVFAFITPMFDSFYYMAVYAAIIGTFPGSFWSLISVLIIDVVGMKDFPAGFGLISLCLAIGAVFSQPLIGWLRDVTGSWAASFYVTGAFLLVSGLSIMLEPLVIRMCMKQTPEEEQQPEEDVEVVPLRRRTSSPPKSQDTDSLLDDENDVSFTSERISKIYRPVKPKAPPESPNRILLDAPLANSSDI